MSQRALRCQGPIFKFDGIEVASDVVSSECSPTVDVFDPVWVVTVGRVVPLTTAPLPYSFVVRFGPSGSVAKNKKIPIGVFQI